jgi:hypothetical protein
LGSETGNEISWLLLGDKMKVLILFLAITTGFSAAPKEKRKVANTEAISSFLATTGLELLEYNLKSGDEDCLQGELHAVTLEQGFSLMLGSHVLIRGLGRDPYQEIDQSCKTDLITKVSKAKVSGTVDVKCSDTNAKFVTTISVNRNGFTYTQVVTNAGKETRNIRCVLEKIKP